MKLIRSSILVGGSTLLLICPLLLGGCSSVSDGGSKWSLANLLGSPATADSAKNAEDELDPFGERDPDRLMWSDLGPGRIGTTLQRRVTAGQDRVKADQRLAEGQELYQQALARWDSGQKDGETPALFREAAQKFELAAGYLRDSAIEHDALFLQGESNFFANDYVQANRAYEILLNRYSGTRHLDLVQLRRFEIAQYWLALDRGGAGITINDPARPNSGLEKHARRILHRIRLDDPTGKLADDATMALGSAFAEAGLHADAADGMKL